MYGTEKKEQFVELRAQGKSFAAIADEIGVSKPTLIEWSRDLSEQIANLKAINDEVLLEKYNLTKQHRLRVLSDRLEAVETELGKRGVNDVPTTKLYDLLFRMAELLKEETKPLTFSQPGMKLGGDLLAATWTA